MGKQKSHLRRQFHSITRFRCITALLASNDSSPTAVLPLSTIISTSPTTLCVVDWPMTQVSSSDSELPVSFSSLYLHLRYRCRHDWDSRQRHRQLRIVFSTYRRTPQCTNIWNTILLWISLVFWSFVIENMLLVFDAC
ncbi:hypothetical protein BV25DRAFT_1707996 [Artomyces pyxidatus]|uniref:Uncharacterized protein n=1 Tax=Artomyces pyxidatus TaxID=48021 RepID=A0ACB8TAQ8_9AGAM|nr:hypothetical protein BV25DRAFT_1707996 [Artomyces pyxidatus]